jgi:hypothetical protein
MKTGEAGFHNPGSLGVVPGLKEVPQPAFILSSSSRYIFSRFLPNSLVCCVDYH